ncbi:LysE family translocator [Streptomyces sp. NBC_01381]|uniref:LysE family translocator n=1 Tax=Streptomyces sp. NBC_01381 TaxID=2903845 RepID=UPI002257C6E7|nr:LysE family translocator [Streptomyces sp. NBC_01381]MCX4672876.1 LysE family translocator [Streptomyces sp. NBC_01381]
MDAQLVAFTGVAAGMVAMPGADFAVVVRNAIASRRAGVTCAIGVAGGLLVHTALAVAGVAAVLAAVPTLFRALQIVGGGYVLYLGYRALRSVARPVRGAGAPGEEEKAVGGSLRQGFLTNALNPKAPITFLSVLPQFVPAGSPAMPRTLLLASIIVALALVWFPVVALLVDRLGRWLRRPRTARAIEGVTGGALSVLGLVLLIEAALA